MPGTCVREGETEGDLPVKHLGHANVGDSSSYEHSPTCQTFPQGKPVGFAKSRTEAYYLLSEKTMRFHGSPVPPAPRRAASGSPSRAGTGVGRREPGAQQLRGAAICVRMFKLEVHETLIARFGQICRKVFQPKLKQSTCGTTGRSCI